MGRKPNALILQHFERGAKLNDSSNRYEHTCKACGEKFPKGRIDSLTTHLVKKCPAISVPARRKAVLELNNLPDLADSGRAQSGEVQMNRPTVELPIETSNWTALQTLAEVSRQMDASDKHDDRSVNNKSVEHGSRASEPPRADRLELQEQYTLDNPPVSYEQRIQRDKKILHHKATRRESESSLQAASLAYHMVGSRDASPTLAMAATSMAAAAAAARFVPSMVDPQLLGDSLNISHQDTITAKAIEQELHEAANLNENYFHTGPADQQSAWPMLDGSGGHLYPTEPDHSEHGFESHSPPTSTPNNFPRPIAIMNPMTTEFSAEYGNGQKANKPKVRGRFTAGRRKEVQEVRKMGACLRCRMLKKPCSGETPCVTCRSVDSARLWKAPCIRTKVAEVIEMFSAGLHAVLAYHDVNLIKSQTTFRSSPHAIEACHFPDTSVFATFRALEGQEIPTAGSNIDPGLSGDFSTNTRRLLDNDNDDLPKKLEEYTKRILTVFIQREPSHFMNVTLDTARQFSGQNELLTRALELWVVVHILVDPNTAWVISERINDQAPAGAGPVIDKSRGDNTYEDLCGQLNAAAEKKAAQMCKDVLNDFEKRLLQRAKTSAFDFFLIAIIILNCVEKSIWLFKSWEQEKFKSRWPLDKTPGHYAEQGDRLTNTVYMLLNVRSSPPKTFIRPDGILATEGDQAAENYFNRLQLNYSDVLNKKANHTFDPSNCRCYELKFCSQLLLPASA